MSKPTVYIETSVIGYLTSWPSGDLIVAGHQKVTKDWWRLAPDSYSLFISALVLLESARGDAVAVQERLAAIRGVEALEVSVEARALSDLLILRGAVPATETADAFHIAVAAVHRMEYLLTWNFKHIANASMRGKIEDACLEAGFAMPLICSPEELLLEE